MTRMVSTPAVRLLWDHRRSGPVIGVAVTVLLVLSVLGIRSVSGPVAGKPDRNIDAQVVDALAGTPTPSGGGATSSPSDSATPATSAGVVASGSPSPGSASPPVASGSTRPAAAQTSSRGGKATRAVVPAAGNALNIGVAYSDTLPGKSTGARDAALGDATALHVGWIRMDLPWRGVQPDSPSGWTWEYYDPTVRAARAKGLDVLLILDQAPAWARDPSCGDGLSCPPASNAAFAAFAGAAARHYSALGVHTFEIWNEPNMTFFWSNPNATRYGQLLSAAADAVHAADSRGKVIVGGLAAAAGGLPILDQVQFLAAICATGACDKIDGVGYHPYTYPLAASERPGWPTPWTRMSLDKPSLHSVLVAAGRPDVPFWLTEFGAPTGGPGLVSNGGPDPVGGHTDHVTEALQASLATDVVRTAAADPSIAALFWHQLQDNPTAGDTIEAHYGLRRADGSAKPAFAAFAAAALSSRR